MPSEGERYTLTPGLDPGVRVNHDAKCDRPALRESVGWGVLAEAANAGRQL
jgi:hypothetical protein